MRCQFLGLVLLALALAVPATAGAETLNVNLQGRIDSLDPAVGFVTNSWQVEYATCLKLVNYPDRAAPAGSVPQLEAAATYLVSRDGLEYTFVVPEGKFFFSNGEPVTAASFDRAFHRSLDPAMHSLAGSFLHDVVGADAYASGGAASIAGVTTQGSLLRIRLARPAADLLPRLAMPFFCAVPATTPSVRDEALPSAGPYYPASVDLDGTTTLRPNPYYTGKRPQRWDEIVLRAFQDGFATETQLVNGEVDYALDGLPIGEYAGFAAAHPDLLFVNPSLSTYYYVLRSSRPLMADPDLRKAFNLALDRNALAQTSGAFGLDPTDQLIPPGVPGYRDVTIFPVAGDLLAAQALAAPHAGETAVLLSCPTLACVNREAIAQATLAALGLNVAVWRAPSRAAQIAIEQDPTAPFDVSPEGWVLDYVDPGDVVAQLLHSGSPGNFSGFADPAWDARIDAADALSGAAREDAYARIDEDVMREAAPIAPFGNGNARDAFSARIGCQTYSPPFGMDLAALCLR